MPSSIDLPHSSLDPMDAPMAFRRQRRWFLSFVMTPFLDVDSRAVADPAPRPPLFKRGR